jgi:hypothetical protein
MSHFATPQPISVELELHLANVRVTASERDDTIVRVRPRDRHDRPGGPRDSASVTT